MSRIATMCQLVLLVRKLAPPPTQGIKMRPMTTPNLATYVSLDIRLLGNFPVSQIAGCRCILLVGNSSISLARRVERINLSPKMLKMASESFIHALLLFLGLFLKIYRRVPLT